ncbi:D-alanyl-D-alanine carboxypeptidase/D-alanyl-D-alanine-endopeptidase [Inquilinus limosus]|uniref:D-alanyl-D-alanine carboxypeptidase/D-alanyl-D-alanine endopeptidase n=1 Tax=Inquilinus limosus TaxID=171674 RepID=UPI003F169792
MTSLFRLFLLLVLAAGLPGSPARAEAGAAAARNGLPAEDIAYILFDAQSGQLIDTSQPARPMIPASTLKVPAMLAAIEILGADHRFSTTVTASGSIAGGVLNGDLALIGGGDPTLDINDLADLVRQVRQAGITRVAGRFIVDDTVLQTLPYLDPLQPLAASYNPGLSGLAVNFNALRVSWQTRQGRLDARADAVAEGRNITLPWVDVSEGAATPYRPVDGHEGWILSSRLPDKGSDLLPIRYPTATAAEIFRSFARDAGITLPGPVIGPRAAEGTIIARHDSEPLPAIVARVLKYSNNLSAEMIGMMAARQLLGRSTVTQGEAGRALAAWWAQKLPQVDWSGLSIPGGSGLSTAARISPVQMAAVLIEGNRVGLPALMPERPDGGAEAGAGEPPPLAAGRLRAKTGTMGYVRGLAGYLSANSGRQLGFAIFIVDEAQRAAADAATDPYVLAVSQPARRWLGRARAAERELLRQWAAAY